MAVASVINARLWAILGAGAATPPLFRAGNRINTATGDSWLKDMLVGNPTAYPRIRIDVGVTGSHSGYAKDETLAMARGDFLDLGVDWEIDRIEEVAVTLIQRGYTEDGTNPLREAVIDDLMRAGPRLGIPETVLRVGLPNDSTVFRHAMRYTRRDDTDERGNALPHPGTVTVIRFNVMCLETGLASLETE